MTVRRGNFGGNTPSVNQGIAVPVNTGNNQGMNTTYSEWKHDLFQIIGTAAAIAAITIPLLQWGIDSKIQAVESKVSALDTKIEARFDQLTTKIDGLSENMKTRQEMYERVFDERTSSRL